jgi:hypothetical protein
VSSDVDHSRDQADGPHRMLGTLCSSEGAILLLSSPCVGTTNRIASSQARPSCRHIRLPSPVDGNQDP